MFRVCTSRARSWRDKMATMMDKVNAHRKMYKGKSMMPGGGGRFAKGEDALTAKGMSRDRAGAIMAARGRQKYGTARMEQWAAAGRKRS